MVQQLSQEVAMLRGAMGMGIPQAQGGAPVPNVQTSGGMGQAQKEAQTATMTDYGARLASRAKPDMAQQ